MCYRAAERSQQNINKRDGPSLEDRDQLAGGWHEALCLECSSFQPQVTIRSRKWSYECKFQRQAAEKTDERLQLLNSHPNSAFDVIKSCGCSDVYQTPMGGIDDELIVSQLCV